ncbi:hypothetical protein D3C81_1197990 [compost metagenome]
MHLGHHRADDLHGVVLLGLWAEVIQVVGTVIDAANEGALPVDHQDLAVQAAKQVGAHAHQPWLRIEGMETHPGLGHRRDEIVRQVGGAVAVHRHLDPHPAPRGIDQGVAQGLTDLVVVNDESFQEDFLACLGHGLEYAGVILLAVYQQLDAVAVAPIQFHSVTCATSGAWSERWDHGYLDNPRASQACALRR